MQELTTTQTMIISLINNESDQSQIEAFNKLTNSIENYRKILNDFENNYTDKAVRL